MESPPSLEAAPLSEDSGLIVTSGSFSSDSGLVHAHSELQESDCDEKSLSQYDSQDVTEHICGDNFNTVKKGPVKLANSTIDPPTQFQDHPKNRSDISHHTNSSSDCQRVGCDKTSDWRHSIRRYNAPRLLHLSPCHSTVRPSSRSSLQTSRLSSSHNSLTTQVEADDSSFITQAISHDTLSTGNSDIADMYNVPFDSDIYTMPIDSVGPRNKIQSRAEYSDVNDLPLPPRVPKGCHRSKYTHCAADGKRHSIPGVSWTNNFTSSHMRSLDMQDKQKISHPAPKIAKAATNDNHNNNNVSFNSLEETLDMLEENVENNNNNHRKHKKNMFAIRCNKKHKDQSSDELKVYDLKEKTTETFKSAPAKRFPVKNLSLNLKHTIFSLFKLKKSTSPECSDDEVAGCSQEPTSMTQTKQVAQRALPSVPQTPQSKTRQKQVDDENTLLDFRTSIQIVKDYGWYWGPISVEESEKLLSTEPDGSFILRDSSDAHYIFTISFKLNGGVRHVRIEHDQGKFCFGSCTMFKARTIVEFIKNAVETSLSGRYLFFLNLRPVLGPVRVQLLYPVSRFKRVQSLQHICRFEILKHVRRDLIDELPLPRRLIDYLSTVQYYSEYLSES